MALTPEGVEDLAQPDLQRHPAQRDHTMRTGTTVGWDGPLPQRQPVLPLAGRYYLQLKGGRLVATHLITFSSAATGSASITNRPRPSVVNTSRIVWNCSEVTSRPSTKSARTTVLTVTFVAS